MLNSKHCKSSLVQNSELLELYDIWMVMNLEAQLEFVKWLEDEDADRVRSNFADLADHWTRWIQKCAACGIRQALLDAVAVRSKKNTDLLPPSLN